ncbi:armadillo-type protein [Pilobolus umbonatus]|nr:armadillo-type protein [Pilobolus umbonatus]
MPSLWIQVNALFSNALPMSPGSMKFLDAYANAIQNREVQQPDVDWWKEVIEKYLQQAASNDMPVIRAAACDTFAYIPKDIFESFHYRYTRLSVALLFSLATDTDGHVRAAACRALGVFILYPSLRDDPMFVSEMAKTVLSHKEDKIVLVRVRSSWAIANLCDALLLESEKDSFNLREYISTSDWIDILTSATSAAMDNDKLRSNAVRAIGSLLRLTPKEYFENTRIMSLIANAMNSLVRNIETGPLKTRWNACHATSNMLSNPYFPIGYMKGGGLYPWTSLVYHALIQSLVQCKNFKVRINACLALNAPNHQSQYGDKLELIVDNILIAWDICQNNHEYKEIKYKEQLEEQIILTLEHMKPWLPSCYHESIKSRIATR